MTAAGTVETQEPEDEEGIWPPESARPRWEKIKEKVSPEAVITFAVVMACVAFLFKELQPSQLFKNTTAAGGDMGAHVWLPAYVKRELLSHLNILGWSPDWYDGFPAMSLYFPLPVIAIALISYVIPYDIAFKLITAIGILALPVAAWAMGRLARLKFPAPAALAAATLPYLFANFGADGNISGGNIASTMAGEFSFSISLALALVFLGLVARGLQNGKHRASSAVVLACCGLSHILPLYFAIAGVVVLTGMELYETHDWRKVLLWALPMGVTGCALLSFWALPFVYRLPYSTNMGYGKNTEYVKSLFPHNFDWLIVLAALGIIFSVLRANRMGVFLAIMSGVSAASPSLSPIWSACGWGYSAPSSMPAGAPDEGALTSITA